MQLTLTRPSMEKMGAKVGRARSWLVAASSWGLYVWLCLQAGRARAQSPPFERVRIGAEGGLAGDIVQAIALEGGEALWAAGSGGLSRVDLRSNAVQAFRRGQELPALDLRDIAVGPDAALWGTTGAGTLFRFDGRGFTQRRLEFTRPGGTTRLLGWHPSSTEEASRGTRPSLWLSDDSGHVYAYTLRGAPRLENLERLETFDVTAGGCGGNAVSLRTRARGGVWVALWDGGLGRIDASGFHCLAPLAGHESLRWSADLAEDEQGRLWVGNSKNTGLVRVNLEGLEIHELTEQHGLPCDNIGRLERLGGDLWMLCGSGVAVAELAQLEAVMAGQQPHAVAAYARFDEGVSPIQRSGHPAPFVLLTGATPAVWTGTDRGLLGLTKNSQHHPKRFDVELAGLIADGHSLLVDGNVSIEGPETTVSVSARLSGSQSFEPRFRIGLWREGGRASAWKTAHSLRDVAFENLPPGRYELAVVPSDESGRWRPDLETRHRFTLRPRLRDRWWARGLAGLGLAGALSCIPLLRARHKRRQERSLQAERDRISHELHDGLGQTLASIGFHVEALEELAQREGETLKPVLTRLKRLVEAAQHGAREAIWDLRKTKSPHVPLPQRLQELAANVRKTNPTCSVSLVNAEAWPVSAARAFEEHEIYLIVQEAVRNATLHAEARSIVLTVAPGFIEVKDDGRGFALDDRRYTEGGRFGILSMRERARRIRARLEIASTLGEGTMVRIIRGETAA